MPELTLKPEEARAIAQRFRSIGHQMDELITALWQQAQPILEAWQGSAHARFTPEFQNGIARQKQHAGVYAGIANSLDLAVQRYRAADKYIQVEDIEVNLNDPQANQQILQAIVQGRGGGAAPTITDSQSPFTSIYTGQVDMRTDAAQAGDLLKSTPLDNLIVQRNDATNVNVTAGMELEGSTHVTSEVAGGIINLSARMATGPQQWTGMDLEGSPTTERPEDFLENGSSADSTK